jgi:hypothetical protein
MPFISTTRFHGIKGDLLPKKICEQFIPGATGYFTNILTNPPVGTVKSPGRHGDVYECPRLEPHAMKVARAVPREERSCEGPALPDDAQLGGNL